MAIVDLTREFVRPELYATRERGVYLMLVYNDSPQEVRDRNGDGRLLVRPNAFMLKSGKFEGSLVVRMNGYYVHLHRRTADGGEQCGIFPAMLKTLLVHFMNSEAPSTVRDVETALKRAVRNLLADARIHEPDQTGHSESRHIRGKPPSREALVALFERVVRLGG